MRSRVKRPIPKSKSTRKHFVGELVFNRGENRQRLGFASLYEHNAALCFTVPVNATEETLSYLDWLRGRLAGDGIPETSWLADQTLEQVLAASEMIGGVLQHGHKVKLSKLSPAQTEEATDVGFSIYSEGADAVEEALDTIRKTSPANAVQAGALA